MYGEIACWKGWFVFVGNIYCLCRQQERRIYKCGNKLFYSFVKYSDNVFCCYLLRKYLEVCVLFLFNKPCFIL